jgi:glycosyltransferase involved in cell wall biosynthesis
MLVRAFALIAPDHPDARLVIAGGGGEREPLLSLIAELGLDDRAQVLSGDNLVYEIYGASDVAVSPSSGEGLPGSCLEALACGLPLVATPCGGQAEVPEDGVSGVLVGDQTPEGLAAALRPLVEDAGLRRRMGAAGRRRAEERFDVRRTARETIAVYDEAIATPRRG